MTGYEILAHVSRRPYQKTGGCFNLILLKNLEKKRIADMAVQTRQPLQVACRQRSFNQTQTDCQTPAEHFWRPATIARLRRIDNVSEQTQSQEIGGSLKPREARTAIGRENEFCNSNHNHENLQTIIKPIKTTRSPLQKRIHLR